MMRFHTPGVSMQPGFCSHKPRPCTRHTVAARQWCDAICVSKRRLPLIYITYFLLNFTPLPEQVPAGDNYYAALNCAVFSDGSFVYIPKGVKCPMELSTYFRINAQESGQVCSAPFYWQPLWKLCRSQEVVRCFQVCTHLVCLRLCCWHTPRGILHGVLQHGRSDSLPRSSCPCSLSAR